MPAVGQNNGRVYREDEIFTQKAYDEMREQPLYIENEPDVLVRPIRRKGSPHFRRDSRSLYQVSVGRRENDPTHNACVASLMQELRTKKLRAWSATFEGDNMDAFGHSLHRESDADEYEWWQDGPACRIPLATQRFIQPDICGRSRSGLFPTSRARSIIVEVIQTHIPEEETFFSLLDLSRWNYLVMFYFAAVGQSGSQYSRYRVRGKELVVSVAHYLLDGKVYRNGDEVQQYAKTNPEWYRHLQSTYFGTPLNNKQGPAR